MGKDFIRQLGSNTYIHQNNGWQSYHIDPILCVTLIILCLFGEIVLYSASGRNEAIVIRQGIYMGIGFVAALLFAQIPPLKLRHWLPYLYIGGILLLCFVFILGTGAKGAKRWLALPLFRFQPSEIIKFIMPLVISSYLHKSGLPCRHKQFFIAMILIGIPVLLVAKQPDLGTALLIAFSGVCVTFLGGFYLRYIFVGGLLIIPTCWMMWHFFMHNYQKQRVLTFLNPERDPLGTGWHIIQSKIAIGSGGLWGKGYLQGSQSHLHFLPESHTDFIFAVIAEEFGFIGVIVLLSLYGILITRGLWIAMTTHSTFCRLAAGSLIFTFTIYIIVNIGMVVGLLPVVGVPLPFISRGGTSIVSLMAGFGILFSIQTHRY